MDLNRNSNRQNSQTFKSQPNLLTHDPRSASHTQKSPSPAVSKTFQSSVFDSSPQPKKQQSPYKPPDLMRLGGQNTDFYRKSVSNYHKQPDFMPRYQQNSAYNRRHRQFYGDFQPQQHQNKIAPQPTSHLSAKQRKEQNMSSDYWQSKYTLREKQRVPPQTRSFTPAGRKQQMLSSSVFGPQIYTRNQAIPLQKQNQTQRRRNHLYSDIFGNPVQGGQKPSQKLLPVTAHWMQHGKTRVDHQQQNLYSNPSFQHQKHFYSSFDCQPRPIQTRGQIKEKPLPFSSKPPSAALLKARELCTSYSTLQEPVQSSPELLELQLTSIPRHLTERDIKNLVPSLHVISVSFEMDNITGASKGTGSVQIRSVDVQSDLNQMRLALDRQGISGVLKENRNGKKNNYSDVKTVHWLDSKLERPKTAERPARECKMSNLESSQELFGNVGRWGSDWKQERQASAIDSQFISQMQWNNTLNARRF